METAEPHLQQALDRAISRLGLTDLVRQRRLGVSLVGITSLDCPRFASVNGNEMLYAASLPKIGILLAALVKVEAGELVLDSELRNLLTQMIRASSNSAATEVMRRVGAPYIASVLRSPRYALYDPSLGGGLWVGKEYSKKTAWRRDPIRNLSHAATANQVARFYYLLETGQLLDENLSREMRNILSRPGISHKFVRAIRDRFPNALFMRKSGTWRDWHADSAVIQHDGRRYIAVGLVQHHRGESILRDLAVRLDRSIFELPRSCGELGERPAHIPERRTVTSEQDDSTQLSPTERFLGLFTVVRPGEGRTVIELATIVLLLLCAYYLVKPLREGWLAISVVHGLSKMEVKAYSGFAQTVLLVFLMQGYGRWAVQATRAALVQRTLVVCVVSLLCFWAVQPGLFVMGLPGTGIAFYLWVGMFGVFVVAQFWSLVSDLYDDESGRRLVPAVAIGATLGAVVGSWLAERLVTSGAVALEHLLLVSVLPLTAAYTLNLHVIRNVPPAPPAPVVEGSEDLAERETDPPFKLIGRNRILLGMAITTLILSWVNTNGENILFRVVQDHLAATVGAGLDGAELQTTIREGTTRFYADFYFWVNTVAVLLQAFVASRLLRFAGFGPLFLTLPVLATVSYGLMVVAPVIAVVKAAKVLENSADYSLSNTARNVFWLPLPRYVTFQAKPAIDSVCTRLGDALAALTVLFGIRAVDLGLRGFIGLNLALIALWFVIGFGVVRMHRRIAPAAKAGRISDAVMGPRAQPSHSR